MSTAASGTTALQPIRDTHPDLVLLDLGLPDIDGLLLALGVIRNWHSPRTFATLTAGSQTVLGGPVASW